LNDRVEIVETLGRYARAAESRDGETLATLFTEDAEVEVSSRYGQEPYEPQNIGIRGRDQIRDMFTNAAIPPGRGMHYLTTDHIVETQGEEATLYAQFLIVASAANARPDGGWPAGSDMMQGTLSPMMIGHYESRLRKSGRRWLFTRHHVKHSLPMAPPPV
jgi:ketosteroid isomerase-like protein